jgi:hypothetical protein
LNAKIEKSLDVKLANILRDPNCKDFILADAKDADMACGMAAPGKSPEHYASEGRFRSLAEFRQLIRDNVEQGLLDIMLMSASSNEQLTINERIFDNSAMTPAARANDTSDIHAVTGGVYATEPSQPFRSATIDHIMCGKVTCAPGERAVGADLGLYSCTFNNDVDRDLATLNAYREFRSEAEHKGFRHFLEVFNPNACGKHCPPDMGRFINDMIARTLAGVVGKGRPIFLKIAYNGPESMEQLASYDRTLVPGILGGAAGTTLDAFHQLWEAKKYGARAALYGRMINNAEHQLSFIQHLRWIADGQLDNPAEAVKSYHAALQKQGVQPYRSLNDDLVSTRRMQAYSGATAKVSVDGFKDQSSASKPVVKTANSITTGGQPDFSKMTAEEKVAWNLAKWKRVLK